MIADQTAVLDQPIGIFPLPAGYFLIGPGAEADEVRADLLAGRRPATFPSSLRHYERALEGDLDGALVDLRSDDSPYGTINRFICDPTPLLYAELMQCDVEEVRLHAEVVAFVVGLSSEPPAIGNREGAARALCLSAWATHSLESGDTAAAIDFLEEAAQSADTVSKPLAGLHLGQLANAQLDIGATKQAVVTFQAAIDCLTGTDLAVAQAELHVAVGSAYQEMSESAPRLMQQAINNYHGALALVNAQTAPETFAIANANLGLAYITMPMTEASDQLRIGVAVQSMRDALNYFSPTVMPDRWASTQLNLANALVYMPSKHQADNIAEAVGLYEGVVQHRTRETDPLGRARVLANQGNALAHLGVFDDAKSKLHEARSIFDEFEEVSAVQMVRSVLDEIAKHESISSSDHD